MDLANILAITASILAIIQFVVDIAFHIYDIRHRNK